MLCNNSFFFVLFHHKNRLFVFQLRAFAEASFEPIAPLESGELSATGRVSEDAIGQLAQPLRTPQGNLVHPPSKADVVARATALGPSTPLIVVDGDPGVGKSTALFQAVLWARSQVRRRAWLDVSAR